MEQRIWEGEQDLVRKLFRNVKNTKEIRKLIFSAKIPFTLVNPKLILDPFQLSMAITQALYNAKEETMTTRTLPTEIIYSLSPSKNISESLNLFSTQDGDKSLIIIGEKSLFSKLGEQIDGEELPMSELFRLTDETLVKKVYQISEEELKVSTLLDSVVSRMACKDFTHLSLSSFV